MTNKELEQLLQLLQQYHVTEYSFKDLQLKLAVVYQQSKEQPKKAADIDDDLLYYSVED